MTGFARVRKIIEQGDITVSLKSVNHRGLDLHFHMSAELDALENDIRSAIKSKVGRGHVQVHVSFVRTRGASGALNRRLLDTYMQAFREASQIYQLSGPPDLNAALRMPGMLTVESEEEFDENIRTAVMDAVAEAVAALNLFREREGAALVGEIRQRGNNLGELVTRMEEIRLGAVSAFHKRLTEKLSELLHGVSVDPQRLAQEAAVLADRSDISEELVRLRTHAEHLADMLTRAGEVGKRLDFLLQEMNRETNTVLSKTGGLGELGLTITDLALAAKSEIDKIREQSLNLE
jgi:uncharacterized protein (TIGR00255 family)